MIQVGQGQINLQFYLFIGFKALDKIDIDDVLPVCTKKYIFIQHLFQFPQVLIGEEFFPKPVDHVHDLVFGVENNNVFHPE